jgi:hypothetical protein
MKVITPETANLLNGIGEFIGGIAGLAMFFYTIYKGVKRVKGSPIENSNEYRALVGNAQIKECLDDIVEIVPVIEIAALTQVTNGGGIQQTGEKQYLSTIDCSDDETLKAFKGPLELTTLSGYSSHKRAIMYGKDIIRPTDNITSKQAKGWYSTKGIKVSHLYFIGIEPTKRSLFVFLNLNEDRDLTDEEWYSICDIILMIQDVLADRKWYEFFRNKKLLRAKL